MLEFVDLKIVAAVASAGSPRKAAASLNTHPATVYRRLNAIERELGAVLFEKIDGRYAPTTVAEEILSRAALIDAHLIELNRRLSGQDARLAGTLTVTTTDTLVGLLSAPLVAFRAAHPEIRLNLVTSNAVADMARHEADVAVRPTRTPPETLVGRKAGTFGYGVYAAKSVAAKVGKTGEVPGGPWIGLDQTLAAIPAARWLHERVADESFVLRTNSMLTATEAARGGLGFALLPSYLGDDPAHRLTRIGAPIDELRSEVWLLTHPDLRHTPRVRVFMQTIAERLKAALA